LGNSSGTGGMNYLLGNGFKTICDMADQSELDQSITIHMYDGLY